MKPGTAALKKFPHYPMDHFGNCLLDFVEHHPNGRFVTTLHWLMLEYYSGRPLRSFGTLNCMSLLKDTIFFYQSVKGCFVSAIYSSIFSPFPSIYFQYIITLFSPFRRIPMFNFTNHSIFFILGCFTHCNYWGGRLILAIFIYL